MTFWRGRAAGPAWSGFHAAGVCAEGAPAPALLQDSLVLATLWPVGVQGLLGENSFIALSRHFKYVKQLLVLGLELEVELMKERNAVFLWQDKEMGSQLSYATGAAAVGWSLFTQCWEGERGVVYDGT